MGDVAYSGSIAVSFGLQNYLLPQKGDQATTVAAVGIKPILCPQGLP